MNETYNRFFFMIIFIHQKFKNHLLNNSNFLQYCMLYLYFWFSERNLLEMHSGIFFLPFYTLVIIRANQLNFIIMQNFILLLSFFIFIIIFVLIFYLIWYQSLWVRVNHFNVYYLLMWNVKHKNHTLTIYSPKYFNLFTIKIFFYINLFKNIYTIIIVKINLN